MNCCWRSLRHAEQRVLKIYLIIGLDSFNTTLDISLKTGMWLTYSLFLCISGHRGRKSGKYRAQIWRQQDFESLQQWAVSERNTGLSTCFCHPSFELSFSAYFKDKYTLLPPPAPGHENVFGGWSKTSRILTWILDALLTYLLHGAESFLRSSLVCS